MMPTITRCIQKAPNKRVGSGAHSPLCSFNTAPERLLGFQGRFQSLSGQAPGLDKTVAKHRHQTLKLGIVHAKLAQMQHRVDDIIDVRTGFPNAPPN